MYIWEIHVVSGQPWKAIFQPDSPSLLFVYNLANKIGCLRKLLYTQLFWGIYPRKVSHWINSLLVTDNRGYIITNKLGFNHTSSSVCLIIWQCEPQIFHMWKPGLPTGCNWTLLAPVVGEWVSWCCHKVDPEILVILFDFVLTIYAFSLPGVPVGCSVFVIS